MLLFLDETGTDHKVMPYEVVGGIAIPESALWRFIQDMSVLEEMTFGGRLRQTSEGRELKAKQLLAKDKFRYAAQSKAMPEMVRARLACSFLKAGADRRPPRRQEFAAYGQACLAYVREMLHLCGVYGVRVFASIVDLEAPRTSDAQALRRDMSFLFERYYYYLEDEWRRQLRERGCDPEAHDAHPDIAGLIVFDELEKVQCRRVLGRMQRYFLHTAKGRQRGRLIIPEPFFVHSDLTTGIQVADIIVYIIGWAYRYGPMEKPVRNELREYADLVRGLQFVTSRRDSEGAEWPVWGITYLDDLRAGDERAV